MGRKICDGSKRREEFYGIVSARSDTLSLVSRGSVLGSYIRSI